VDDLAYGSPPAIYVMRADGSHAHEIISDANALGVNDPHWSPDGTKILYWGDYNSQLYVSSLHTGRNQLLGLEDADVLPPAWGTPGIAYIAGEDETRIMLYDPTTGHSTPFATAPYQIRGLAWSRAGRLAVLAERGSNGDWVIVYSGRGRELGRFRVKGVTSGACGVSWSPDGARLLVVGYAWDARGGPDHIGGWVTGQSGGPWRKLPFGWLSNCAASWR
jgi:Tol biopolymer transport system component